MCVGSMLANNPQRRYWSTSVSLAPARIGYVQQTAKLFSLLSHIAVWLQRLFLIMKELYGDTFDVLTTQRYLDNIEIVDSVDPYSLPNSAWSNKENLRNNILYLAMHMYIYHALHF